MAKRNTYVDIEAMRTGMTLQKGYIDARDQAIADQMNEFGNMVSEYVMNLQTELKVLERSVSFFVASYDPNSEDFGPVITTGNESISNIFDFLLLDTSDNKGMYTTPVGKLKKDNFFHFDNGDYAPVVGITQEMYDDCMNNDLYTKGKNGTYTKVWTGHEYNPVDQWNKDKPLIAKGQEPTILYKKVGNGYQPVSHVLRPWETTETKYTIGVAPARDLYILDNQVGDTGAYWKGIFTEPIIWDGIDLKKFKLPRTAIGLCPMTTIVENGVTKSRCFFYLYEADNANCKSDPGFIPNNPFYNKDRHYPRVSDVSQITNKNWARNNNADPTKAYPFAEGGWWATNAYIIALELWARTRYLHDADLFGSGISSNAKEANRDSFEKEGGIRLRVKGKGEWNYRQFNDLMLPYCNDNTTPYEGNISGMLTKGKPIEACMESQMAASMATELGLLKTIDGKNLFKFYGNTYYCQYFNSPEDSLLSFSKGMNVRVYKVQSFEVEGYEYDESTGISSLPKTFEMEIKTRMSLFNGVNLSGDIWAYNGGGLEHVGKYTKNSGNSGNFDNPISVYLQLDQKQWHNEDVYKKEVEQYWDFEKTYRKLGEYKNFDIAYVSKRMANAPDPLKKDSSGGLRLSGEAYAAITDNDWSGDPKEQGRYRIGSLFRGAASSYVVVPPYGHSESFCSPRFLDMTHTIDTIDDSIGGTFQALIDPSF